ncbi:restriction endonuclease subunit S [Cytobacillus gottheilii]|uniref:restriction endonuclease subunit S n=1 Tax=Cytobacillus gottheilii TaxID=859144 RepID=UPI0009BC6836|nr:restriction endonuclease subunit S [Cytobacillus gottheilii]
MTTVVNNIGWKKIKLGEVIELFSGQHIDSSNYNTEGIGIPYISGPADFHNGQIIITKYTNKPKIVCKEGDILITVKGSGVGKVIISDGEYGIGRQLMAIRTPEKLRDFIYYNLQMREKHYNSDSTGLIPGISRSDILNDLIYLPLENKVCEGIGNILKVWDKSIELKEKLIEQKGKQQKGLMQRLLWGHIRISDIDGGSSNQELDKRKILINKGLPPNGYQKVKRFIIPRDWKFVKISEIANQVTTVNKNNNKYVVLSCTKYDGLVDSLKYFGKQVFSADLSKYKVVSKNEFAYATNHIEEGSIGLQRDYDYGLVSPMYTVFRAKSNINNEFLFALLKTENYRRIFETMMSASVDRRGSLRWNDFSKIRIPFPSIEEQNRIMFVLQTGKKELDLLEKELEAIKLQKKGLMQQLLIGKVRV